MIEEPKDRRTTAWKQWNASQTSVIDPEVIQTKGLGDVVETITKATGIKAAVDLWSKTTGKDCKCEERKEKLNKLFLNNKPKCFNKSQYEDWTKFKNRKDKNKVETYHQVIIIRLLKEILNMSVQPCATCSPSLWRRWIQKIDKVYDTYKEQP